MTRIETLPCVEWPALTLQAIAVISDAQFAQAGIWRLRHVRIDLPMSLAGTSQTEHQPLRAWFAAQGLCCLLTGARRHDVALHLQFEKFS